MKTRISIRSIRLLLLLLFIGISNGYATFQERVYLQTDKQVYMAGELLWLKLYTTNRVGQLRAFSKVGYVELMNDSQPEIQVRLDVTHGTGNGWMELPVTLPTGYYRLVAYTRYMLNEGEEVRFEKKITVINPYLPQENQTRQGVEKLSLSFPMPQHSRQAVTVSTDQTNYHTREKGWIRIQGLPADSISFSVSIAGSDLIVAPSIQDWKEGLPRMDTNDFSLRIHPEYEGPVYEGQLMDRSTNQPATEYGITGLLSFPGKELQVFNGQTDAKGHICFYTGMTHGKREMAAVVLNRSDKSYRIDLQSPFASHTPRTFSPIYVDSTWQTYLEQRSLGVQVMQVYTGDSIHRMERAKVHSFSRPYRSYRLDEYTRFPFMEEVFTEIIPVAKIRKREGKHIFSVLKGDMSGVSSRPLVLFDNIPITDQEQIYSYNPLQVEKIDVYLGYYLFGGERFDGILSFTSYNGDYPNLKLDPATQLFDKWSTQPTRLFYVPDYDNEQSRLSDKPDFRHTLLWKPDMQTQGEPEIVIPFYTSDLPGDYTITIEGIGKQGTIVNAAYQIQVTAH